MFTHLSIRRRGPLVGLVCFALTVAACGSSIQPSTQLETPAPSSSIQRALPASSIPDISDEYGTCQVMGPSEQGWEIFLELQSVLGAGDYLVSYALRDESGTILETATREISMDEEEVLAYWDSLVSSTEGVVACDIRSIENGPEVCTTGNGCTLLTVHFLTLYT